MRYFFFFIILLCIPVFPPLVLAVLMVVYALLYEAYELLFVALAIDVYFGATSIIPWYTVSTTIALMLCITIKPRLMVYADTRET